MTVSTYALVALALAWLTQGTARAETVYEALSRQTELRKFYEMVNRDEVLRKLLQYWPVTVFAPTNEAIERDKDWVLGRENKVVSYHVLNLVANKTQFPFASSTTLAGAPPVYMGVKYGPDSWTEYYVNNARITRMEHFMSQQGSQQVLYMIDEILQPYLSSQSLPPTAYELLQKPEFYSIKEPLSAFLSRVEIEKLEELFQMQGNHTFFIPVGAGVGHSLNRQQEVDKWVIRGHVIPKNVLFTRLVSHGSSYRSEAYGDDIKVELSIINESSSNGNTYLLHVQSNTIHSSHRHKKGVVISKIMKPNIPVGNGVVHLIENPLMIVDVNVWKFLQNEKDGRLSDFLKLVSYAPDFRDLLMSNHEKTLFVPSNEAIKQLPLETMEPLQNNITAITNLLKLHLVMKSISTDDVTYGRIREYLSADKRNNLYFRTTGDDRNKSTVLTVDGVGVKATVIQSDIGAVDGMVHVIDRLLGMPYQTIYLKLQSDPDLSITYELSEQDEWSLTLDNNDKRFTFFVPSNGAWEQLRINMPTEYKQLTMGAYPYHVHKILDRHLVVGKEIRSDDLDHLRVVQMVHGNFKVNHSKPDYGERTLQWEGLEARIIRPDVQAVNGVIHVIDKVMMKRRDLTKSSASGHHDLTSVAMTLVLLCLQQMALLLPNV